MIRYVIEITLYASQNLKNIAHYYYDVLQDNKLAESVVGSIADKIDSLQTMPLRHQVWDEGIHTSFVLRRMYIRNYFIYYTVNEEESKVFIIAIISKARDQSNALNEVLQRL